MIPDGRPFIRSLHPGAALSLCASLFVIAMLWDNPLWLGLLLLCVVLTLAAASPGRGWSTALMLSLSLAAVYILVNALFSRAGETVLWRGPSLPLVGRLSVSLEALVFGLGAGLKIALAVCIFRLYAEIMEQDAALGFFSRIAPKSALTLILAALLIPRMRRDLARIRDVLRLRGVPVGEGGIMARVRSARPLLGVLLLSSLEGSWDIAAALDCRAFGSGRRTSYSPRSWRARDVIVTASAAAAAAVAVAGLLAGKGRYSFYPRLSPLSAPGGIPILACVLCLSLIAWMLNLVWKKWPSSRSRI